MAPVSNHLLIIGGGRSDLGLLMQASFSQVTVISPDQVHQADFCAYSAVAFLGGGEEAGIVLLPPWRRALKKARAMGVRVFAEFSCVDEEVGLNNIVPTRFERLVCLNESPLFPGLERGMILDEQWNERFPVQYVRPDAQPVLQYHEKPDGFYRVGALPERKKDTIALWLEEENLMICTFRMQQFAHARFSPRDFWASLISGIVTWLGGDCCPEKVKGRMEDFCRFTGDQPMEQALQRAADWFRKGGFLVWQDGQPYTTLEGVSSKILPHGKTLLNRQFRTGCTGETAHFFFLLALLSGDEGQMRMADGLYRMIRDMQIQEGTYRGMIRGSLGWWNNVSYHDDSARGFLLPLMLRRIITGDTQDDERIRMALEYLYKTTGSDGLRPTRVDYLAPDQEQLRIVNLEMREGKWRKIPYRKQSFAQLRENPVGGPSTHYNAYYLSSMALGGKLLGEEKYLELAKTGFATLLAAYPDTAREHSFTQEACRLIQPLSIMYYATGDERYRQWLLRVTQDLDKYAHPSGGYLEWDEGYTGACSRSEDGESGVYAFNGDPVCDLLYSSNWLLHAFMMAHLITGDQIYLDRWQRIGKFLTCVQLRSIDPYLDGGWARAVDMQHMEIHGVNNDVDWSCWTIESGWTVAEIGAGMALGMMKDRLAPLFRK